MIKQRINRVMDSAIWWHLLVILFMTEPCGLNPCIAVMDSHVFESVLYFQVIIFMSRPTVVAREHQVFRLSVHSPSISPSFINIYSVWFSISSVTDGIWMKLGTKCGHTSGHCWKGFQGQRSKVMVVTRSRKFCVQRDITILHFVNDLTCVINRIIIIIIIISLYLMEKFLLNLTQTFVMWAGMAGKVSRSWS